jgi:aryl-alcohol dehydrogenase-like predicted oxidoreductase
MEVDGSKEYVKAACTKSLERLGTDRIDLYSQHRVDPNTPVEETVASMAELKAEGKIRYLGLSECSARTLKRACKIHPIAAAEIEFSPFALEIEDSQTEFLAAARELGVVINAYSPLGKGFLTGSIKRREDFAEGDARRMFPRFSEENFKGNRRLVEGLEGLEGMAGEKACTTGQLVLAWILA